MCKSKIHGGLRVLNVCTFNFFLMAKVVVTYSKLSSRTIQKLLVTNMEVGDLQLFSRKNFSNSSKRGYSSIKMGKGGPDVNLQFIDGGHRLACSDNIYVKNKCPLKVEMFFWLIAKNNPDYKAEAGQGLTFVYFIFDFIINLFYFLRVIASIRILVLCKNFKRNNTICYDNMRVHKVCGSNTLTTSI